MESILLSQFISKSLRGCVKFKLLNDLDMAMNTYFTGTYLGYRLYWQAFKAKGHKN